MAVAFGLRSGGRGGPLTLEAAVVQHELLAPVPHEAVVRGPAIKQLRFLAFAGLVVGAIVGVLATRELHGNPVAARGLLRRHLLAGRGAGHRRGHDHLRPAAGLVDGQRHRRG